MVLRNYESIAGEAAWEWRLWGSKSVTGWPCKCWQQQGESEQTVPVAHQPCSFQDFLQVFYRMQPRMNIFYCATCIFWLVIYSSAFTSETWEKKPILIQRQNPDYYKGLFSTSEFDRILREVIHPLLISNLIHRCNITIWCYDSMKGMHGLCRSNDHYVLWSFILKLEDNFYLSNWNSMFIIHNFKEDVQYGVNLDVTSYTNGRRETHNPPGRALPYNVWGFYKVRPLWCSFVYNR